MPARTWLRLEAATLVLAALFAYDRIGASWWLFATVLLAPDLSMLGYLAGPRIGAWTYNLAHTHALALTLTTVSWLIDWPPGLAVGLVWIAHLGLDRALGYGLKSPAGFRLTHLGPIGRPPHASG